MAVRRSHLMLLLLSCSALAANQGFQWRAQQADVRAGIAATRAQWVQAAMSTRWLDQRLAGAATSPAPSVDIALARAIVRVRQQALVHLIKLGAVTVGNFRGSNGAAPVASVREATMTGLAFVPVKVQGTYTDVTDLLSFVTGLAVHGTTVRHAQFEGQKFTLDLEVFGT